MYARRLVEGTGSESHTPLGHSPDASGVLGLFLAEAARLGPFHHNSRSYVPCTRDTLGCVTP